MGNILNDIVEEIDVKPNKSKLILKWVLRIGGTLIGVAFVFGQIKMGHLNRLDGMEAELQKQGKTLIEMKAENQSNFDATNARIDKVYSDGVLMFNDYQEYNRKQFELVIDYGQDNKEMLKKMLELNALERKQNVAMQAEQAKNPPTQQPVIGIRPQGEVNFSIVSNDPYFNEAQFIDLESQDTIFQIKGATKNFIDGINKRKYEVGAVLESPDYPGRYDFSYRNK